MNTAEILSNFIELKKKINSGKSFVCFNTKNGRRFITTCATGKNLNLLSEKLEVVPTDKEYTEPFDLIMSYYTDKDSVQIDDLLFFPNLQEVVAWLGEKTYTTKKEIKPFKPDRWDQFDPFLARN